MSTTKATASKATKKKVAAKKQAATAADQKAAATEVLYHCEVIALNPDGSPVVIGQMICGIGARTKKPKAVADALVEQGLVRIIGVA